VADITDLELDVQEKRGALSTSSEMAATSKYNNPRLDKIDNILTYSLGAIVVIIMVIYAGVRGTNINTKMSTVQSTLISTPKIIFPAVTLCPLENVAFTPLECLYESKQVESTNCLSSVKAAQFKFEGVTYNCFTFNDPADATTRIQSTSLDDELVIQLSIDKNAIVEELGALCMVHEQGQVPELESHSAFLVDVGKVTDVWVRKEIVTELNGVVEVDWSSKFSTLTLKEPPPEDPSVLIDLDFTFEEQGYYKTKQIHVYTSNNWVGEVGGLAFLLYCLHQATVFVVMAGVAHFYHKV